MTAGVPDDDADYSTRERRLQPNRKVSGVILAEVVDIGRMKGGVDRKTLVDPGDTGVG